MKCPLTRSKEYSYITAFSANFARSTSISTVFPSALAWLGVWYFRGNGGKAEKFVPARCPAEVAARLSGVVPEPDSAKLSASLKSMSLPLGNRGCRHSRYSRQSTAADRRVPQERPAGVRAAHRARPPSGEYVPNVCLPEGLMTLDVLVARCPGTELGAPGVPPWSPCVEPFDWGLTCEIVWARTLAKVLPVDDDGAALCPLWPPPAGCGVGGALGRGGTEGILPDRSLNQNGSDWMNTSMPLPIPIRQLDEAYLPSRG